MHFPKRYVEVTTLESNSDASTLALTHDSLARLLSRLGDHTIGRCQRRLGPDLNIKTSTAADLVPVSLCNDSTLAVLVVVEPEEEIGSYGAKPGNDVCERDLRGL